MSARPAFLAPDRDPRHLEPRPWGGTRLLQDYGLTPDPQRPPVGEAWELSTLPAHPSFVGGQRLHERLGGPLPFLVKLLDTAAALSVQVHPADGDEGSGTPGKEEAWVILASAPGAWIRAGLSPGVTAPEFLDLAARAPTEPQAGDALLGAMNTLPTSPGTCILLPGGTPHALGPGLLLAEVQQPTDRTFRLFDHGRGRALHLKEAARVLRPAAQPRVWQPGRGAPLELAGAHVHLAAAGAPPGTWPAVVIPALGDAHLESPEGSQALAPGRAALWMGPDGRVRGADGGLTVVGWVERGG